MSTIIAGGLTNTPTDPSLFGGATPEQVAAAVADYIAKNPVNAPSAEQIASAVEEYLKNNPSGSDADTLDGKHSSDFASAVHTHSYNELKDKPTAPTIPDRLPANGGNADTVGGKTAEQIQQAAEATIQTAVNTALQAAKESGKFNGEPGLHGLSAYQLAVQQGFVGTVAQWLDSLVGQRGISITTAEIDASGQLVLTFSNGQTANVGKVVGNNGTNGTSPVVSVSAITGGNRITITDANGTKTIDVLNGSNGNDGTSPTVSVNKSGKVTTISIAGKNGTKTATINDGSDGKTPAKGVDYFTEADKEEIVQAVTAQVGEVSGVPEYVVAAADAVIDKVAAAQGGRTLTIGVITDLHYGSWGYYEGVTDYRDGVNHACQALKHIDERIKLDAVAVLGDYTDGMASTQQGTAIADFKSVNAVLDKLRFAPNLRLQGNHDFVAEKSPLAYRYIGAYSDGDVEWGNALGGYFYKDFGAQKLRVIGLNTSETGNGGVYCSVAQYEWFIRALDLSDKANAEDWGILILSHVPLDMWAEGGKYRFAYILDAYKKGGGWSDDAVACDFAGKNAASLVGCIHGHVHNFKADKLYLGNIEDSSTQIDVWRMATPNACFGLENKDYTGYQEATTYTKAAHSASDTAFCVYCVDLDSHTIKAICYGAGVDRTLNYKDGTVITGTTYGITNNLVNVSNSNNSSIIAEGSAYTATLSTEGEMTSVTVTMGGVDITATVYANGTITIPRVTGDIVITATAVVVELVNVLAASTDVNGNVYNGVGWKKDTRWSGSSNAEQDYSNVYLSGWIPYDGKTGTVYMKNVATTSRLLVWYFKEKGGKYDIKCELGQGSLPGVVYGSDGNVISFQLEGYRSFIRIECSGFSANSIVTINQPIE